MARLAVAALAALALVAPGGLAATSGPRILPSVPYGRAFRGAGFVSGERVSVTIVLGERRMLFFARAGRDGRFLVRAAAGAGRCGDIFVRAVGSRGSRATLELPRPACREP